MTDISLTDIVDYVGKVGTPKLTHARNLLTRDEYSPEKDHYRRLRMGIQEYHKGGGTDKKELDKIITGLTDPKKHDSHRACVSGYKKWLGRKTYEYFAPPFEHWSRGDVNVRVNPELGLKIGDTNHVVKLYFKSDPLKKSYADLILSLMGDALGEPASDTEYSVLDVRRRKLFSTATPDAALMPLVEGEAASLSTIWAKLPTL